MSRSIQELADALVQVWEEIPQETIRHLIRSMPRRWWMERDMMSQMCSIGFRSGERAGQSIASMPSSCRNC